MSALLPPSCSDNLLQKGSPCCKPAPTSRGSRWGGDPRGTANRRPARCARGAADDDGAPLGAAMEYREGSLMLRWAVMKRRRSCNEARRSCNEVSWGVIEAPSGLQ